MPEPQVLRFLAGRDDPDLAGVNSALEARTWHEEQILGFDAVPRSNSVVEIVITHRPTRNFRILDSSPAQGVTLGDDTGESAPDTAYVQASKRFDPSVAELTGAFLFNGSPVDPAHVSIEGDGHVVRIDLSALGYGTKGTKTVTATGKVVDIDGIALDQGHDFSWHVEAFTNVQTGLRQPPGAAGRQGKLRVARISVDHAADVDRMVVQWQDSLGLQDRDVLHKVHVTGQRLDTKVYVLYFASRVPVILQTFPTSGSVMPRNTVPDRMTISTDLPLHPGVLDDPGAIEIDGVPVGTSPLSLSDDGRNLELDLAGFDAPGHHTVRFVGLKGVDDLPVPAPVISSFTVSDLIPTGGIGSNDHGALSGLGDDDHAQYHNDTRGDARYYREDEFLVASAGAADAGKPVALNPDGLIDPTMLRVGALLLEVAQGSHGFSVRDPVYRAAGSWLAAVATAGATLADGIVAEVPDSNRFIVCMAGAITVAHALTVGSRYYLDTTAGQLTATPPSSSGQWVQEILRVISTTVVVVKIGQGVEIP